MSGVSEQVVYAGRWVPTSNWSTEERAAGVFEGLHGFERRTALEYIVVF